MNRPLVFVDLDRTLYKTKNNFLLREKLAEKYGFDAKKMSQESENYYEVVSGDSYYYDFFRQLDDMKIDGYEASEFLANSNIADGRMEIEGASELMSFLKQRAKVKILTFGERKFQNLKARMCPSLRDIEIIDTLARKGEYLRDKGACWLIDDKPIFNELPDNVGFIWVSLEDGTKNIFGKNQAVTSLHDVKKYLDGVI